MWLWRESFLNFLRTAKILEREFPAGSRELQLQSPTLSGNFVAESGELCDTIEDSDSVSV
jgi:hypothetical protein